MSKAEDAAGIPSAGGYDPSSKSGTVKKSWRRTPIEGAELTRARVEIDRDGEATVVDVKPGPLTFVDKLKGYYHTIIIIVAGLLAFLTEISPLGQALPEPYRSILAGAIIAVGALLTFLKSNEVWIERL